MSITATVVTLALFGVVFCIVGAAAVSFWLLTEYRRRKWLP